MLHQKMKRKNKKFSILALLLVVVLSLPGSILLVRFQEYLGAIEATREQTIVTLDQEIRELEQSNLQLQLKNETLSQNETAEIQRRLGVLEIEQRLSDGTASLEEQINALKEAEQLREANIQYMGGLTGPDGHYLATHN